MEGMSASPLGHVRLDRLNDIVDGPHNLDADSWTSSAPPARHVCRANENNQHLVTTPFLHSIRHVVRTTPGHRPPPCSPCFLGLSAVHVDMPSLIPAPPRPWCPSLHLLKSKMSSTVEVPEEQMAVEEENNLASEEGNNLASGN